MNKPKQLTTETPLEVLNAFSKDTMIDNLGIEYIQVAEGYVKGAMPVDNRTRQPFGILSGGSSLAFAETLGGLGSSLLVDNENYRAVGSQLSANHIGMAYSGKVIGEARIIHQGRKTHVWNIDITTEEGKLVSTARLTNVIIDINK